MKKMSSVPLPSAESAKAELNALLKKKDELLSEFRTARSTVQEYETIKKNLDLLLTGVTAQRQKHRQGLE